jgi:hypothetical protein
MRYKVYLSDASNYLLFTTVRIEVEGDDSAGIGTGFFFDCREPGERTGSILLVTNKHVVEGAARATIHLHRARRGSDGKGQFVENIGPPVPVSIPDVPAIFFGHSDPAVDLCAAPWSAIEKYVNDPSIFYECVHSSWIMSDETLSRMRSTHPIQMVGYPYGLADEYNNFPLIRHGFTSLQPSIDFEARHETVIDIATDPGSSGSPVFVLDNAYFASMPCFVAIPTPARSSVPQDVSCVGPSRCTCPKVGLDTTRFISGMPSRVRRSLSLPDKSREKRCIRVSTI